MTEIPKVVQRAPGESDADFADRVYRFITSAPAADGQEVVATETYDD